MSRDAFLRGIQAEPDDDAPRLVFADWLDEHGDPVRAEFIRLQCALAADPYSSAAVRGRRREGELIAAHAAEWVRADGLGEWVPFPEYIHLPHYEGAKFRRGFIDSLRFEAPAECRAGIAGAGRLTPLRLARLGDLYRRGEGNALQGTYFRRFGERMAEQYNLLPDAPHPFAAHADAPSEFPDPAEFREFVASPEAARLRGFAIDSLHADRRALEILCGSPLMEGLRELDLGGNLLLQGADFAVLADTPALAGVENLGLDGCWLHEAGLAALVDSPHLTQVRSLSLTAGSRYNLHDVPYRAVTRMCLPRLEELNLNEQQGGGEALALLAAWPGLVRLRRLGVSYSFADGQPDYAQESGLRALLHSPHWGLLREIDLSEAAFTLAQLRAVVEAPKLRTLRVLRLVSRFGLEDQPAEQDEAARMVLDCPHLSDGLELHFCSAGLGDRMRGLLTERFGEGLYLRE